MFRRFLLACLILPAALASPASTSTLSPPQQVAAVVQTTTFKSGPKPRELSKVQAVAAGMALAFNSGYSNGCCLGGGVVAGENKQAVAAVTGAWTTSALGLAGGNKNAFNTQIRAIASYIGGSAIAGAMIPRPTPFKIAESTGPTFLVGAALMFAASQIAARSPTAMTCFYLALMANGLQNSVTSVHTANLCRTAHFSGISSDMGTFLGQILRGNHENAFKLKAFALLGLSFWLGGFTSYFVTQTMTSGSLLFSALLQFLVGMYLTVFK